MGPADDDKGGADNVDPNADKGGADDKGLMGGTDDNAGLDDDDPNRAADDKGGDDDDKGGDLAERPEHVPEQFWDKDKGEVRIEALTKSYEDLRKEANRLREDKGKGAALETPEAYLEGFTLSTTRGEGDEAQTLDRVRKFNADDPALLAFAKVAKKLGLSKDEFDTGLTDFLFDINAMLPAPIDLDSEREKLGGKETAAVTIGTNKRWLKNLQTSGEINEAELGRGIALCSDALGVQLIDKLRTMTGEAPIPLRGGIVPDGAKSKAELEAMIADPLYRDPGAKGDAYREKVDEEYKKSVGTAPSDGDSRHVQFGGGA
tara:strand:+ start:6595 stop:7548 length:954 start_codon:yes stop_codon:yes gene_type:complete